MCNKECKKQNVPHQEKIELIYAMSNALEALNGAPRVAGAATKCPVRTATQDIAKELSKLISPQD